jgi:hypothetical protein
MFLLKSLTSGEVSYIKGVLQKNTRVTEPGCFGLSQFLPGSEKESFVPSICAM